MRVFAVYHVAGHEGMHDPAHDLNTQDTTQEAYNQDPGCLLGAEAAINQRTFCGWKHAVERGEKLGDISL